MEETAKVKGFLVTGTPKPAHTGNVLWKVVIFVLLSSFFERSGYYTGTSSLVNFYRYLGISPLLSNNLQATFQAIVYVVPIAASILVDAVLGRFIILPICLWAAAVGMGLLSIGEHIKNHGLIYTALFGFVALFDAPIKSMMMVLGGDQFDLSKPDQVKQKGHMFQMYYWFTNIAAGICILVAPMIAQGELGVGRDIGFLVTFIASACFFAISGTLLTTFGVVMKKFWIKGAEGSKVGAFIRTTIAGATTWRGKTIIAGFMTVIVSVFLSIPNFFVEGKAQVIINWIIAALVLIASVILIGLSHDSTWVKAARSKGFSEETVAETESVWRLMPYIAFCFPFWAVYNQMNSNFINQACQLNGYYGDDYGFSQSVFAAPSMSALNCFAIVIMIPILDYGVFPGLEKCGIKDTVLRRMGVGLLAAVIGVWSGAILEWVRLSGTENGSSLLVTPCGASEIGAGWCDPGTTVAGWENWVSVKGVNDVETFYARIADGTLREGQIVPIPEGSTIDKPLAYTLSKCADRNVGDGFFPFVPVSSMAIWWSIVPHAIVGLGEVTFAAICTDFFYSQVPPSIRAIMQSLNMLTVSLGTLLGAIIDVIFKESLKQDLNRGSLYWPFITMGCLGFAVFILFLFRSRSFVYRVETPSTAESDSTSSSTTDDGVELAEVSSKKAGKHTSDSKAVSEQDESSSSSGQSSDSA